MYKTLSHPMKLVGFSDAAFKAQPEEASGLALRGMAMLLMEAGLERPCSRSGTAHLLDYLVRRIRRVVRSTFSAELNALIDSIESMILSQVALHEIFCGVQDVKMLVQKLESGSSYPPLEVVTDAMSVFEAVSCGDCCTPTESSLKLHLLSVRDRIQRGVIHALHWSDTRDMVADGLTKGGVGREMLVNASQHGLYKPQHPSKTFRPRK